MDPTLWAEIKRLYFVEKMSKSEIARLKVIDRGTVKRAIESKTPPKYNRPIKQGSKLDIYKGKISELLSEYPSLSIVRILEEIKKDGYQGGRSILSEHVSKIRGPKREKFLRIETLPGEQAQCDWGNFGYVYFGEYKRPLSCFVMTLSFSRLLYLEWTVSQCLEDFIRCHVNAFNFFGGVTKEVLYDNLKQVVLQRSGKEIHFNPKFMEFAGIYLFRPIPCRPGRGSDKGKTESGVKYIRNNFWAGRKFTDFWDIKKQGIDWRDNTANQRIHGTTHEKPVVRFERERNQLKLLPPHPYDCSIPVPVKSSKDCRIKFDSNIYSVPFRYGLRVLTVKAAPEKVNIYCDHKLICSHPRSYLKYQVIENPAHYKGLLGRKTAARPFKLRDEFLSLGKEAEKYFKGLIQADINLTRHLDRILKLRHKYGKTEIMGAIHHALKYGAYGAQYIENIIIQRRTKAGEPVNKIPISISNPELANTNVEERDLANYDELLEEGGQTQ